MTSTTVATTKSPEKPRRNLIQTFEALCVVSPDETVKEEKSDVQYSGVSPTAVSDFHQDVESFTFPDVDLHPELRRDLSLYTVQRVSCYSIIHDINKEATTMASYDPLNCASSTAGEEACPLVLAANGGAASISASSLSVAGSDVKEAVIDEEKWLLAAIEERSSEETKSTSSICPSTFLQAMGEKEYENPVHSVTGNARTQLWKPSRSWWEAKSGKNPWIEPASHNKRWRYLWPLIHYHKFLAKCVKKLKRNGVDVKVALNPVSVFLREEVCAVSDHLASVSMFDSDEWMYCLQQFNGWTVSTPEAVSQYRAFVASLPLRPMQEPGDVDSPVLRNHIDESFLRTMAQQRELLRETATVGTATVTSSGTPSLNKPSARSSSNSHRTNKAASPAAISSGPPPVYPRGTSPQVPKQIHGVRRPRFFHPNGWYGWPTAENYQDTSSVHSELSANSFPQPPNPHAHHHYHMPHPHPYPPHRMGYYSDHSQSTGGYTPYDPQYWIDPAMAAYVMHHQYYGQPPPPFQELEEETEESPFEEPAVETQHHTPFKYDPECTMTTSPYWSHLDHATMTMGLSTPATVSPASTPRRPKQSMHEQDEDVSSEFAVAPLIRHYPYGGATVPPSPATQFVMSSSYAYGYSTGFSPTRRSSRKNKRSPTPNTSP
jgi:hypothetical protein